MSALIQDAFVGLRSGGAYALIALGVVLIYRGSGVLNFSQGAMGMFGTYAYWEMHVTHNIAVVPSIIVGIAAGALISLLTYLLVIRRLGSSSELVKVIATIGLTIALESAAAIRYGISEQIAPPISSHAPIKLFGADLPVDTAIVLGAAVILAVVLALIVNHTRLGTMATALRDEPMAAAAVGISPHFVGVITWSVGGALAALAGILLVPLTGLSPTILTLLVIPAMAAGLLVKFNKIILTAVFGILIGVLESELQLDAHVSVELIPAIPFIITIIVLVLRGSSLPGRGSLNLARMPAVSSGRIPLKSAGLFVVVAAVLILTIGGNFAQATTSTCLIAVLGLSVVVITGYAGQLSLAPYALAGIGSLIAARLASSAGFPFPAAVIIAAVCTMVIGAVLGAPAVRVRGVNLAVATIGLSLLVEQSVLTSPSLTNGFLGINVPSASLFGLTVDPGAYPERYALLTLIVLVLCGIAVANIRRGASGRRYLAVRANERGAASLGISVPATKLRAFAISSLFAGLAGALMTYESSTVTFSSYTTIASISLLAFAFVAGVGYISGAVFVGATASAALLPFILQDIFGLSSVANWLALLSGLFVMDAMARNPNGVIPLNLAIARTLRGRLTLKAGHPPGTRASSGDPAAQRPHDVGTVSRSLRLDAAPGGTVLTASDVSVRYGGVQAVSHVSLELRAGKILGVIGPNGAGKTSLIDAMTGYAASAGSITVNGRQLGKARPSDRARAGIARTFQNLELFEDLSVRENLLAAVDSQRQVSFLSDLVAPGSRALPGSARAAVEMLGISEYVDQRVDTLPQGVRRLVGVGRALAQRPRVLCLDEPAAGLSGTERSMLVDVFKTIARDLNVAVLLVEHDVDMVAATCDEVVVLNFGDVIARGAPADVLMDREVRAAYLGIIDDVPEPDSAEPAAAAAADGGDRNGGL